MTLHEVAAALAGRMDCEVLPGGNSTEVLLQGKGYQVTVAAFFGGWQATLTIPNRDPITFYGEVVQMLELRLKAKLSGRESNF